LIHNKLVNMFCPKCKSLCFPKDGVVTCNKCGYQIADSRKKKGVITKKREREFIIVEEAAATLPTTDVSCPKCGNGKAFWVLRQTRAADEPETRIFRCTKCSHSWREY